MLTVIPPKSTGDIYIGAASGYKPAKIIAVNGIESTHYNRVNENPSMAITSNSNISSWDTKADIVMVTKNPHPIEATCMLDEAGCITTDSSKAKSILYQKVKDGQIITRQGPVSDMDREIAKLRLEENNKFSYWACSVDGAYYTWEI